MQIVKLGGSLITAKRSRKKSGKVSDKVFLAQRVDSAAKELTQSKSKMVVVHGAGSFGHVKAHKYGLHKLDTKRAPKPKGVSEVSSDVRELNLKVMKVLTENGINGISVPPNVTITNRNGRISSFQLEYYKKYLALGLVPVSFGDLVSDTSAGISICSGDDIMLELAKAFKPKRAVFVTDEDGVYDANPTEQKNVKLITHMTPERFKAIFGASRGRTSSIDVTGGMLRKAEICLAISKLGTECIILNGTKKGRLERALRGRKVVGTYF